MNRILHIPAYNEYNTFIQSTHTVSELKIIMARYKLKGVSRKKQFLIDDIYSHLRNAHHAIKIQKHIRGFFSRRYYSLRGPAVFKRELCINDTDFYTFDDINTIHPTQFISFKDTDGKIYGFDIISLNKLYFAAATAHKNCVSNPYTRNDLDGQIQRTLIMIIKLNTIFKYGAKFMEDKDINKLTPEQHFSQRITSVFKAMDDLGNYTSREWFTELTSTNLCRFLRELNDIWSYRAQLTQDTKDKISNFKDPFCNINMHVIHHSLPPLLLQKSILQVIENFVYSGIAQEHRSIGAFYILTALTLVSESAATALPWLYQSVAT